MDVQPRAPIGCGPCGSVGMEPTSARPMGRASDRARRDRQSKGVREFLRTYVQRIASKVIEAAWAYLPLPMSGTSILSSCISIRRLVTEYGDTQRRSSSRASSQVCHHVRSSILKRSIRAAAAPAGKCNPPERYCCICQRTWLKITSRSRWPRLGLGLLRSAIADPIRHAPAGCCLGIAAQTTTCRSGADHKLIICWRC
jgi:hypothetical protein